MLNGQRWNQDTARAVPGEGVSGGEDTDWGLHITFDNNWYKLMLSTSQFSVTTCLLTPYVRWGGNKSKICATCASPCSHPVDSSTSPSLFNIHQLPDHINIKGPEKVLQYPILSALSDWLSKQWKEAPSASSFLCMYTFWQCRATYESTLRRKNSAHVLHWCGIDMASRSHLPAYHSLSSYKKATK